MKGYPTVLSEEQTVAAAQAGCSIARYGDGEMKLCLGADCVSQRRDPALAAELRSLLTKPIPGLLVCIPNINGPLPAHKKAGWAQYSRGPYLGLLGKMTYGSAFISRPDSAPWIDTPEYWASVRALWAGRDVVLLTGHYNEIRTDQVEGAARVNEIVAPRQHAYEAISSIEEQIRVACTGDLNPLVLMCLGPTATVLAARLARRGIQALDLGHLGMFMRHAGQYRVQLDQLITMGYQDELVAMHASEKGWGGTGGSHAPVVRRLIADLKPKTILDYGCGRGGLRATMEGEFRILEYDPGVPGKAGMPKPVDLVVCTDVAEHIEPKMVDNVLAHIYLVAEIAAYFVISLTPSKRTLPGGRNCHLSLLSQEKWLEKLRAAGFSKIEVLEGKGLCVVAYR